MEQFDSILSSGLSDNSVNERTFRRNKDVEGLSCGFKYMSPLEKVGLQKSTFIL